MVRFLLFSFFISSYLSLSSQIKLERFSAGAQDSAYVFPIISFPSLGVKANNHDWMLPPTLDSLPSGIYVVFDQAHSKFRTVTGSFPITEGKINGVFHFEPAFGEEYFTEVKNGKKNGVSEYYRYGKLKSRATFRNDTLDGAYVEYYSARGEYYNYCKRIKISKSYKSGRPTGAYVEYYPNGQIKDYVPNWTLKNNYNKVNGLGFFEQIILRNYDYVLNAPFRVDNSSYEEYRFMKYDSDPISMSRICDIHNAISHDFFNKSVSYHPNLFTDPVGEVKSYYEDGSILYEGSGSGKRFRIKKLLYKNGRSFFRMKSLKKDTFDLVELQFFDPDGRILSQELYLNPSSTSLNWRPTRIEHKIIADSLGQKYRLTRDLKFYEVFPSESDGLDVLLLEGVSDDGVLKAFKQYYKKYRATKMKLHSSNTNTVMKMEEGRDSSYSIVIEDTVVSAKFIFRNNYNTYGYVPGLNDIIFPREPASCEGVFELGSYFSILFSEVLPIKEFRDKSFELIVDGVPFTGVAVIESHSKTGKEKKLKLKKGKLKLKYYSMRAGPTFNLKFRNGLLDGICTIEHWEKMAIVKFSNGVISERIVKDGELTMKHEEYENGKLEGCVSTWEFKRYYCSSGFFSPFTVYSLKSEESYRNGELNGESKFYEMESYCRQHEDSLKSLGEDLVVFQLKSDANLSRNFLQEVSDWKDGELEGKSQLFSGGERYQEKFFLKGLHDGPSISFFENGDTSMLVTFKDGLPEGGFYAKHFPDSVSVNGSYKDGFPSGVWDFFSQKNNTKTVSLKVDSFKGRYIDGWMINVPMRYKRAMTYDRELNVIPRDFENLNLLGKLSASMKTYYPNGNVRSSGYLSKGEPHGEWLFYTESAQLVEVIVFQPNMIFEDIPVLGTYISYGDQGKMLQSGAILLSSNRFDCNLDLSVQEFEKTYSLFINNQGDTLVEGGNGYLVEKNRSGVVIREGRIENTLKVGEWKEYDENGNLSGVGEYKKGRKNGEWLEGELKGIPYKNKDCYVSVDGEAIQNEIKSVRIIVKQYQEGIVKSERVYLFRI